jgi:hypothetical protein
LLRIEIVEDAQSGRGFRGNHGARRETATRDRPDQAIMAI